MQYSLELKFRYSIENNFETINRYKIIFPDRTTLKRNEEEDFLCCLTLRSPFRTIVVLVPRIHLKIIMKSHNIILKNYQSGSVIWSVKLINIINTRDSLTLIFSIFNIIFWFSQKFANFINV